MTRGIAVGMEFAGLVHGSVRANSFPGRCAARSGALLIRGPRLNEEVWVPALRRSVKNAALASGTRISLPIAEDGQKLQ